MQRLLQIHPFTDGNGRLARLLFIAMLGSQYGIRAIYKDFIDGLFDSDRHLLVLASLRQVRTGDWTEVLMLLERRVNR